MRSNHVSALTFDGEPVLCSGDSLPLERVCTWIAEFLSGVAMKVAAWAVRRL
jgi:hypothetical protein